jgi:chromosome segregation ATPase
MMWLLIVAWFALLGAAALFAQQALGFNLDEAPKLFNALPFPQQALIGLVATLAPVLVVSSVWQASGSARRNRQLENLQSTLDGIRKETVEADEAQRSFDAAGGHLSGNDPVDALTSLQQRLIDAEQRTAHQKSRTESVDLRERLDEIKHRQHTLRKVIGEVSDKRRTIEPIFGELKQRQIQLEEALSEIETDDAKNSLSNRLKEVSKNVGAIQGRLKALEDSWETLGRYRQEIIQSSTQLVRLQSPQTGVAALIDELRGQHDQLTQSLGALETHGNVTLGSHVESLSKGKIDTEQRLARLGDCFATLDEIRRQFGELEEQRAHLERAIAEVETDASGRSLADRQNELHDFTAQTRVRVRVLQDSSTALSGFKQDMEKSQAALVPLQAPKDGLEALIAELRERRDRLSRTIDEIESQGEEKLSARVEALYRSKVETEQRIAAIVAHFAKLDTIRKEVNDLFVKLNGTLDRLS